MIKTLFKSSRQYTKGALITICLSAIEVGFEIVIPLTMSKLIDYGINAGDTSAVWRFGLMLLFFALMQLATGMGAARLAARSSAGFASNLRLDMYNNIQSFSFKDIDKFSTASIVTRLTTDVTNVQQAYQMLTRVVIRSPLMFVFSMVAAFRINREISTIFLVCIPILIIGLTLIIRRVMPLFKQVFRTYDELNNVVQEDIRGIRVVKSFNREDYEVEKFSGISAKIFQLFSKAERTITLNNPLMQGSMYVCMLLVSWISARAIVASGNNPAMGLTTGDLTALITYSMQTLSSLMILSMVFAMMTIAGSAATRIVEVLNEKTDIHDPENPVYEVKDGSVSFEHVDLRYSKNSGKKVLDDINLRLKSGESLGIIGNTGSSKSSLVQLIPRLYDVTAGSVKLGGVDVRDYDIEALRNAVAMVLQKNVLFSGTIAENLRWGNENATDEEIKEACKLACADEFVEQFPDKYNTYIEEGGTNVSGGQKQRLCIARALLKKPKVLILDDSTSAVDTKTDSMIQESFKSYIPTTTKIIISQRISSVQGCDKIIVMDDGKISAMGTHDELVENCPVYKEIYISQQKGGAKDGEA